MYHVFHGGDVIKLRHDAFAQAALFCEDGGTTSTITDEAVTETMLRDLLGSTSLFRPHEIYILDTLSRNPEAFEALTSLLPELKRSENIFVIIEEKLDAKTEKVFATHAERSVSYPEKSERAFNVFSLTDALALRDKKTLWILLTEAWRAGKTSEEIIGTLLWQLKSIRLAALTMSAADAKMKPFVYDKAKRALKKFSSEELTKRSHDLVMLYHEGHTGRRDIDRALERWVLSL